MYNYPTIDALAAFISSLALGTATDIETSHAAKTDAMRAMAARYCENFVDHQPNTSVSQPNGHVVLLTGTTGSLGCYSLAQLDCDRKVSRIYALNRASRDGASLRERQKSALVERGLNSNILDGAKMILLEGDLSATDFGLPKSTYKEVSQIFRQSPILRLNLGMSDATIGYAHHP